MANIQALSDIRMLHLTGLNNHPSNMHVPLGVKNPARHRRDRPKISVAQESFRRSCCRARFARSEAVLLRPITPAR
jgi:hypothetical protein